MSSPGHTEYAVGTQRFSRLEDALDAAPAPMPVYRLLFGGRGCRHIEVRTAGGHWRRTQTAPGSVLRTPKRALKKKP